MSAEDWQELENLRVRIFNRMGMNSSAARAYTNFDLDMFRAFDALLTPHSSSTHQETISRAVIRLRAALGVREVAHLITEEHVNLETTIHGLMMTARLMHGERYDTGAQKALNNVVVFVYQNMNLKEQVKAALRLGVTDSAEVITMALAGADGAIALTEGTL